MTSRLIEIAAIGNPIVDIVSSINDLMIEELGMQKFESTLIDKRRSEFLRSAMHSHIQLSGGSAANTAVGLANFGASVGYIGKVHNDPLGNIFRGDMTALNIQYSTAATRDGCATSHSLIFVPSDARRIMNTFIGASASLTETDLDQPMIEGVSILYLEGHLFGEPGARIAMRTAASMALAAGRRVALSLPDLNCIGKLRRALLHFIETHIDIVFANRSTLSALLDSDNLHDVVAELSRYVTISVINRGALGHLMANGRRVVEVPTATSQMVDTTGRSALHAAGFLFGLLRDRSLEESCWIGSLAAAEAVSHYGARPASSLQRYVASRWSEMPIVVRYAQTCRGR